MSLHYFVKYECRKWHHSEIRIAINDELQGSIAKNLRCVSYFTTHLSLTLLVKEFLSLVNIWRSYGQNHFDCVIYPIRLALLSSKMQISPDKLNNLYITETVIKRCYVNRRINVS